MASKPGVPDALIAIPMSATSIELSWQPTSTNHTGIAIQRRLATSTTWEVVGLTGPGSSFRDTGLRPTTRYVYRVRAENLQGASPWSATATATTGTATTPPPSGQVFYAALNGRATNAGTLAAPWDLPSALTRTLPPGSTLSVRGGTYKAPKDDWPYLGFPCTLAGTAAAPITVRPYQNERVTLDGGLWCKDTFTYVHIRDLEVIVSEPRNPTLPPDHEAFRLLRPWGGVNLYSGRGIKLINLVLKGNSQAISTWLGSSDVEIYGCLISDTGWPYGSPDAPQGTGHAIYGQNDRANGSKVARDCIITGGYGFTHHWYGEAAAARTDDITIEGNFVYDTQPVLLGGVQPVRCAVVKNNALFYSHLYVGYLWSEGNVDCVVRENTVAHGGITVTNFARPDVANNLLLDETPRSTPLTWLRPNAFDPSRAHLAVYNPERRPSVPVDLGGWLKVGDRWGLKDPADFYSAPLQSGVYQGGPLVVSAWPALKNLPDRRGEWGCWVLLRTP